MTPSIQASIWQLPEPNERFSARDLWAELAEDVAGELPDKYGFSPDRAFRLHLISEAVASPDKKIVRYRTIEGSIRRAPSKPTLLELSVGNLFATVGETTPIEAHFLNEPRYATWSRSAGKVPLNDHHRLVGQFVDDLSDACWLVEPDDVTAVTLPPPQIVSGNRTLELGSIKYSQLTRNSVCPGLFRSPGIQVVDKTLAGARHAASLLTQAFRDQFPSFEAGYPMVHAGSQIREDAINLVLLDASEDLGNSPARRQQLRAAESADALFKLAKTTTLSDKWALRNIAYDLFTIAGGQLWRPATTQLPFCCLDAGHDPHLRRSRWVKVESDQTHTKITVSVHNTVLAEHIPTELIDPLWPSSENAILCRDGRLSQERDHFVKRATLENRPIIEVKKYPRAILWRIPTSESGLPHPAVFGDALVDSHGDILIQSTAQVAADYVRPLRLTVRNADPVSAASHFLHQHTIPSLSLFRVSRLPGALYFADLISKMDEFGWPKAIGRGFRVPSIIP